MSRDKEIDQALDNMRRKLAVQSGMIQGLIKTQDDLVRQIQDLILWKTGVEFNAQKYIDDLAHEQEVNQRLRQPDELKQEKA